jgi:hypothetical protein
VELTRDDGVTSSCIFAVCVVAIMSIGLLITAQVLTGVRLLRFIGRLLLLAAGVLAAYWILKLLLIPGTVRIFEALKQIAAGLAYMALAVILLFGITQLIIFTFKKRSHGTKHHREKKEL